MADSSDREQFGAEELAICLSHYDLGIVKSIQEFARGSRRAPKVVVECDRGKFLFKRRARGKDDLDKVAFTHQIQLSLAGQNFPLPHLIGTRDDNNSMLVRDSRIYELFEFITGGGYDGSLDATLNSGRVLGLYHKLLQDAQTDYRPPTGSYHGAGAISQTIRKTVGVLSRETHQSRELLSDTAAWFETTYQHCAEHVNGLGLAEWPVQIVHADWHPGNMLYRDQRVTAVIDYDAARRHQRVIDLANGALQFSIIGGADDLSKWPDYLDEIRFKRFLLGYDDVSVISKLELKAVPCLMCEAMIVETVLPIAATGKFGRMEGFPFLQMMRRKVEWILDHADELCAVLKE